MGTLYLARPHDSQGRIERCVKTKPTEEPEMWIEEKDVDRVMAHMLESHGICFRAIVIGQPVKTYELKPGTEYQGVRVDLRGVSFNAKVGGVSMSFCLQEPYEMRPRFKAWIEKTLSNLGRPACMESVTLPDEVTLVGNVSDPGMFRRHNKEKAPATT